MPPGPGAGVTPRRSAGLESVSKGWGVIGENRAEHVGQEDHSENSGSYSG